jgi:hypothetical protein
VLGLDPKADILGRMRLVLDTDVIRSGLQSSAGASRLLLCGIAEGAFVPLVTTATLLEIAALRARGLLRALSLAEQHSYLAQRAAGAPAGRMAVILGKAGTTDAVLPGDETPEDWLETPPG